MDGCCVGLLLQFEIRMDWVRGTADRVQDGSKMAPKTPNMVNDDLIKFGPGSPPVAPRCSENDPKMHTHPLRRMAIRRGLNANFVLRLSPLDQ